MANKRNKGKTGPAAGARSQTNRVKKAGSRLKDLSVRSGRKVRGGTGNISFNYSPIKYDYKPQSSDGPRE